MKRSSKIRLSLLLGIVVIVGGVFITQKYDISQLWKRTDDTSSEKAAVKYENFDTSEAIKKALAEPEGTILTPETMAEIDAAYKGVRMTTMPRIFIDKLPADWQIKTVDDKTLFMKIVTALILRSNEKIVNERAAIRLLEEKRLKKIEWNEQEYAFFDKMVQKYDSVLKRNEDGRFSELMTKINIIPNSMAVAQAVMFTDWGQKYQQSIYGEYGWKDDETYEPIVFESLIAATDSFALQINSRSQMYVFREMRRQVVPYERTRFMSEMLVTHMKQYMELDDNYIDKLIAAYNSGYIKELDHACFNGTCTLYKSDPNLEFE